MGRDVLYKGDSLYQHNQSSPEPYGLCAQQLDLLCMITAPALPWFSQAPVPSATVTKSEKHQSLCAVGICPEPRAARASLCWNLSSYCSPASLNLSWLSQSMLGALSPNANTTCELLQGLHPTSNPDITSAVAPSHPLTQSHKYHCKISGVLETLLYQKEVYSSCFLYYLKSGVEEI